MFNSVALNVVVGLIFIYLLYSLLATVLSEMIASLLGLRARNLKEAISRMLNDDRVQSLASRFWNSIRIGKTPDNEAVNRFFNNPEIKYLGGGGLFRKPSSIRPSSFSRALISDLSGNGEVTPDKLNAVLKLSAENSKNPGASGGQSPVMDKETSEYLLNLWKEAEADVDRFKLLLEDWFNRTMEQASEWYKRKIQFVLLVLGFCMAWFFYADTFVIVQKLSNDNQAREQLVSLANTYVNSSSTSQDTSLFGIKKKLETDIVSANTILGLGGWPASSVQVTLDPQTRVKTYNPPLDPNSLSTTDRKISNGTISFSFAEKLAYLFRLGYHHFFGFLLTAIAVSLGAPFWFDLLNKIMRLRTSSQSKTVK